MTKLRSHVQPSVEPMLLRLQLLVHMSPGFSTTLLQNGPFIYIRCEQEFTCVVHERNEFTCVAQVQVQVQTRLKVYVHCKVSCFSRAMHTILLRCSSPSWQAELTAQNIVWLSDTQVHAPPPQVHILHTSL